MNNDYRPLFTNFLASIFSSPLFIKGIIDSRISFTFERILKILMIVQLPFYILEILCGLLIFGYDLNLKFISLY